MKKFRKKGAKAAEPKKGHVSPMQKKGWATEVSLDEATELLRAHVTKGAAWSGDDLVYLNALWDATTRVATELGYVDQE